MIIAAIAGDGKTVSLIADHLEALKVRVIATGGNCDEAVKIYKKYRPDILFLCAIAHKYDANHAIYQIRSLNPHAKIVLVADRIDDQRTVGMESRGPDHTIPEPLERGMIARALQNADIPATYTDRTKAALVSFVIEKSLLKISNAAPQQVGDRLYAEYGCYFSDCLMHAEYLKAVLEEIFGNGSTAIINAIRESLADFEDQHPISDFLQVICR